MPERAELSIIIPVLNESANLDRFLRRLFALPWLDDACEVIVCDGGSSDDSIDIASHYPCRVERSEAGRARQMNRGAGVATAPCLLFLHADSMLPSSLDPRQLSRSNWGFFRLRLDDNAAPYRVIESMINWRTGWSQIAGGDQALFFSADFFAGLGGYPEIPLMEDVAICRRAKEREKPLVIQSAVTTSSRRWQDNGLVRTVLLMWSLRLAYYLGVSPERLHRIYYPQRG